jgi:hypothetical protein
MVRISVHVTPMQDGCESQLYVQAASCPLSVEFGALALYGGGVGSAVVALHTERLARCMFLAGMTLYLNLTAHTVLYMIRVVGLWAGFERLAALGLMG